MTKEYIVNLWSVRKGRIENWLQFTVTIGGINDNRQFKLDFCGTELNGLSLSPQAIDAIRERFVLDYNHAPYNLNKCKQILKRNNCFIVEVEED